MFPGVKPPVPRYRSFCLSELEVNERLDFRTFHLNDQINHSNYQYRLSQQGEADYCFCTGTFPTVRYKVQEVT